MDKCPSCKQEKQGKYWCKNCKSVFLCPAQGCATENRNKDATECSRCGLLFEEYIRHHKMYRVCPKCKKKQGLSDPQCRYCRYWFNCPSCGHRVTSTSMLTCPRCATGLR